MRALNIFVVDDDATLVECISELLEEAGYSVEASTDSREALQKFTSNPAQYDVLVSDNNMPHISGGELICCVRRAEFRGKVVMYSGSVSLDDEQTFKALGADAILRKPFDLKLLIPTIEDLCSLHCEG